MASIGTVYYGFVAFLLVVDPAGTEESKKSRNKKTGMSRSKGMDENKILFLDFTWRMNVGAVRVNVQDIRRISTGGVKNSASGIF